MFLCDTDCREASFLPYCVMEDALEFEDTRGNQKENKSVT